MFAKINEHDWQEWLRKTISTIPPGHRLLDAGAGELKNKAHCGHLKYVSQDFGQYAGKTGGAPPEGLQRQSWDTSLIDLVSDVTNIPAPDVSFDVIVCSEVLEHVPEPTQKLDEFIRLQKPGGGLLLAASFASNVHVAPYYYCTEFSRYWYEHHFAKRGFNIAVLAANGDWFALLLQEIKRQGGLERKCGNWTWPLAYAYALLGTVYFKPRANRQATDLACFGWCCVGVKRY